MKVTDWTRARLRNWRETRDMINAGWEYVGEGGGQLWELYRGCRLGQRIVEAKPSGNGLGVWVRIT